MVASSSARRVQSFDGFLNRNEAADLLGCSITTLLNWERKGLLRAVIGMQGGSARERKLYDPRELARMPRKRAAPMTPGEIESRAFDMLDRGHTVRRIVIELRITSDEAWAIREKWLDANVSSDQAEIEIDADAHPDRSDVEIERGIHRALSAEAEKEI